MISRTITSMLHNSINHRPAVALLGARQIGKTTLAKMIAQDMSAIYLDLEAQEDLFKLQDPTSFLSSHADKLIIIDEIQRAPDLFTVLRGLIDKNRATSRSTGQFLLLGPASAALLRQSSESLAGRISYITMSGLNVLEAGTQQDTIQKLWMRGGFPESYLASDNDISWDWLEDFIRTYLERDVPQLGFNVPSAKLRRLWTMLAHLQGEPINYSKLAANLEISSKTVRCLWRRRYLSP